MKKAYHILTCVMSLRFYYTITLRVNTLLVRFSHGDLANCYAEHSHGVALWGAPVAEQYSCVVNFLTCIDSVADLATFLFLDAQHRNTERGSQWTVQLIEGWRLTLELDEGGNALILMEVWRCCD